MYGIVFAILLLAGDAAFQTQNGNRAQVINNIFQIPIQTLTAISNLAQSTRPLGEILQRRRYPVQLPLQQSYGPAAVQALPPRDFYSSRAARIAGIRAASDGSAFRI